MNKLFLKRYTTVSVRILTFCLLLEIFLRIGGGIAGIFQGFQYKTLNAEQSVYRVLCIGGSATMLGGKDSYPSQLQDILNNAGIEKIFTVINKGIAGRNTNYILQNLNAWMDEYNPDMVIAMMGINDSYSLVPFVPKTPSQHIQSFLKSARIYKVFRWLKSNWRMKTKKAPPLNAGHDIIKSRSKNISSEHRKLYQYVAIFEGRKRFDLAEEILRKLIHENPGSILRGQMYKRLGNCLYHQGKYDELLRTMEHIRHYSWPNTWLAQLCTEKRISRVKNLIDRITKRSPDIADLYDVLAACYADTKNEAQSNFYFEKARQLRAGGFVPLTKTNYVKLTRILKQRHIKAVYVQYPLRSISALKRLLESDVDLESILFVDNEKVFQEAIKTGTYKDYFTDRFAGNFGHCTPKGNKLLAQNIANVILKGIPGE